MQFPSNNRREEVAKVIRSCLISRQGDVTIKMLDRDYEEFEGEPIPFREFNCPSLLVFLNQLRSTLWVEHKGGQVIVHQIDTEKSRHISSLVERQRPPKQTNKRISRRPYHGFCGGGTQVSINSLLMMELIRHVKEVQKGLSIDWAIRFVNQFYQPVQITRPELERQLRAISHEIAICGNLLYPANRVPIRAQRSFNHIDPRFNHIYPQFNHIYPGFNQSSRVAIKDNSQCLKNRPEIMPKRRSVIKPMQKSNGEKQLLPKVKEDDQVCKSDEEINFRPAGFTEFSSSSMAEKAGRPVCRSQNKKTLDNSINEGRQNSLREKSLTNNHVLHGKQDSSRNEDLCGKQHSHKDQDSFPDNQKSFKQVQSPNQDCEQFLKDSSDLYRDSQDFLRKKESPIKKIQSPPCHVKDSSSENQNKKIQSPPSHVKDSASENQNPYTDEIPSGKSNEDYKYENLLDEGFDADLSGLIKVSTKIRLANLIHQYPDGIWCADLPEIYMEEYKTPLIYTDLGFFNIQEFASHLPKIFHCVRPTGAEDYKLYNAEKPLPNLRNEKRATNQILNSLYPIYDQPKVLPDKLDSSTLKMLLPERVMGIGESVDPISVIEFGGYEGYEEVEISEVLSPSFFWVQLRRKLYKFRQFIKELNTFYEKNEAKYKIPLMFLEKGLNVACFSDDKWQRGIIKSVSPDGRTMIHFYDCGTEKILGLADIYFLHRSFSYLPAQAIPCGLFNVKPYQASKWTKSIIWEFITKTSIPLIATVGSTDIQGNSILVTLTDTRGEDDFHINDWMYDEKFGEQGQIYVKNQNFAFLHYKECLKQKGYDPSSIHKIRPERLKLDEHEENVETKSVEITPEESKPIPLRLKRTQALLAQYQTNQGAEILQNSKLKETLSYSGYERTFESPQVANDSKSTSFESESGIKIHKKILVKQNLETKDSTESVDNLDSGYKVESPKCPALKTLDSSLLTNTSDSDSMPTLKKIPLLLEGPAGEKKGESYFGTIRSECGGNGRMEPINWTELRAALIKRDDQSSMKAKLKLKAEVLLPTISNTEVPLANSCSLNFFNSGLNSAYYDKNVHWIPGNNLAPSRRNTSSLLNLKQKLLTNSFKQSSVLVTPRVLRILKGESQDSEEGEESLSPISKVEEKIQEQQEEVSERKKQKVEQLNFKELPPRIRKLLELQSKIKSPITEQ